MSFKNLFNVIKKEGYITAPLDRYLFEYEDINDRAVNVNAPSQAGNCNRQNYYSRMNYKRGKLDPRSRRIFDNGTFVHKRLQEYLLDMELLLIEEVPLINDEFNIQGHTDGILTLKNEIAILEIKSMNDMQFKELKDTKEEHKKQGLIYLYCAEQRRLYLHSKYKNVSEFNHSYEERYLYFKKHYQYLKDSKDITRDKKIEREIDLNILLDNILFYTNVPITKVIFLYENKNTQELKEFVLERSITTESILKNILQRYDELNYYCTHKKLPPKEGNNKSCELCKWCSYTHECYRGND